MFLTELFKQINACINVFMITGIVIVVDFSPQFHWCQSYF